MCEKGYVDMLRDKRESNNKEIARLERLKKLTPYERCADVYDMQIKLLQNENEDMRRKLDIIDSFHTRNEELDSLEGLDYHEDIEYRRYEINKIMRNDMYTTETTTETSTECVHEFCDVYDYKDEQFYGDHHIITKKYILTYCKVCGYTINRPCTE